VRKPPRDTLWGSSRASVSQSSVRQLSGGALGPRRSVWDSFQGDWLSIATKASLSIICSSCHEFMELHVVDLSVHVKIYPHLLITGILY
jgi:hypothetical protein